MIKKLPLIILSMLLFTTSCSYSRESDITDPEDSVFTEITVVKDTPSPEQGELLESILVTPKPKPELLNPPAIAQTGKTKPIPQEYLSPAEEQGDIQQIIYDSKDYAHDHSYIRKKAYVYLPYGYDENTSYNILYLMHGWYGYAGQQFEINNGNIKNLFDNMIEKGDMEPMIIVSPTYYHEGSSMGFDESVDELRVFHFDFEENLMQIIEGQFNTFAEDTTPDGLESSRNHRAFAGFSLGSVTTWMAFCYDSDYIGWFMPISASCWYYGGKDDYYPEKTCNYFEELIEEKQLNDRGYFIYAATGTKDTYEYEMDLLLNEMLKRNDVFTPEHLVYYKKDNGEHDYYAVQEYLYNALPYFFRFQE